MRISGSLDLTSLLLCVLLGANTPDNLVPNPGFEDAVSEHCGLFASIAEFNRSIRHWTAPTESRPGINSTIVDRQCWNYIDESILEESNGKRAALILLYSHSNFRSYVQVKLLRPLKGGKKYDVQISVRVPKASVFSCNNLGLYFSDTAVYRRQFSNLNYLPQVNFNQVVSDTVGWIHLRSRFESSSNAEYMIIGNFYDNPSTRFVNLSGRDLDYEKPVFLLVDNAFVCEVSSSRQ